ncbi:MAG: TetR/AcrR family transcriptional regulator [Propionibacteriaceae bacterium]|nr:TetR/AcrR family transcriptional regulator [Propionibacteriaceae bacterium]
MTRTVSARQAILNAAAELIRLHGVAGTSIADVIARSGTSAGAIYHHFGSKEQLVLEVGKGAIARPMAMILRTQPGLSPADILRSALARVAEDEGLAELLLQIWAGAKSDPALFAMMREEGTAMKRLVIEFMRSWCAKNAPSVDPTNLTDLLLGLVMGFAVQRALTFGTDLDTYADIGAQVLAAAIETR